jgi:hypothetical protein
MSAADDGSSLQGALAFRFADEFSKVSGIPATLAFDALTQLPENMLCLLGTPEGWSALAAYIADECGRPACFYQPTRH